MYTGHVTHSCIIQRVNSVERSVSILPVRGNFHYFSRVEEFSIEKSYEIYKRKYINGINLAFLLSKYLIIDGYKGFADLNRLNRYGGEFVRKIAERGGVTYLPQ